MLDLGQTYYWRVDEVNEADAIGVWEGDLWSFSTQEFLVVDDFESYTDYSPNRIFQTWIDGWGFSEDDFFPDGHDGNGTGAQVGNMPPVLFRDATVLRRASELDVVRRRDPYRALPRRAGQHGASVCQNQRREGAL